VCTVEGVVAQQLTNGLAAALTKGIVQPLHLGGGGKEEEEERRERRGENKKE